MSQHQHHKPTPVPPISSTGCRTIRDIFQKYKNIDVNILDQIMKLVFVETDENEIVKQVKISKNKLYRYVSYWMVKHRKNIWVKVSERPKGKITTTNMIVRLRLLLTVWIRNYR